MINSRQFGDCEECGTNSWSEDSNPQMHVVRCDRCGHEIPSNCLREFVPVDKYPKRAGQHPTMGFNMWEIDGNVITERSLMQQRLYFKHPDGRWSQPKDHESINSLDA